MTADPFVGWGRRRRSEPGGHRPEDSAALLLLLLGICLAALVVASLKEHA